jgi:hypothetical protein
MMTDRRPGNLAIASAVPSARLQPRWPASWKGARLLPTGARRQRQRGGVRLRESFDSYRETCRSLAEPRCARPRCDAASLAKAASHISVAPLREPAYALPPGRAGFAPCFSTTARVGAAAGGGLQKASTSARRAGEGCATSPNATARSPQRTIGRCHRWSALPGSRTVVMIASGPWRASASATTTSTTARTCSTPRCGR